MNDLLPDLLVVEDFLSNSTALFEELRTTVDWDTCMSARHTASFGVPYNYSQMSYPAVEMPPALVPVADRLRQTLNIEFNNCLLNYYLSGDSTMGFHSDDTTDLKAGTGVAIISLGHSRDITFRSKASPDVRRSYPLASGSLLYMDSSVQEAWMHAVKKQRDAGPRISLTWRAFVGATEP